MSRTKDAAHSGFGIGISLLEFLIRSHRSLGVSQIAEHLGMALSTTHDMLKTLIELGLVEQNVKNRTYHVTPQVLGLAHNVACNYGVNSKVSHALLTFSQEEEVTACIAVLSGQRTYISYAAGALGGSQTIGAEGPVWATAAGKAIVSAMPREEWDAYMPGPGEVKTTSRCNADPDAFVEALLQARENGCAWNIGESESSIVAVAAPLWDGEQRVRHAAALMFPRQAWRLLGEENLVAQLHRLVKRLQPLLAPGARPGADFGA
ncbi:MAG: IclR family transcriptional regulator [Verrucomicrobia bacterium]|nr:IclR family transcriptional regulator [Verrucomicrobiota bacterium]MCH8526164.1 IclR family transcriptional regulator [Kiritimatiellia bacterium]